MPELKDAIKAVKTLQDYCGHFANCYDCPFGIGIYCAIKCPTTYDINLKEGENNEQQRGY